MVRFDGMQGMIAGYVASPRGQEAIRNYLSSPEGKKTLAAYLKTPEGQKTARLIMSLALEELTLPAEIKEKVLAAVEEKMKPVS